MTDGPRIQEAIWMGDSMDSSERRRKHRMAGGAKREKMNRAKFKAGEWGKELWH